MPPHCAVSRDPDLPLSRRGVITLTNTLSKSASVRSAMSITGWDLHVAVKAVRTGRRRTSVNETRFETAGRDPREAELPTIRFHV